MDGRSKTFRTKNDGLVRLLQRVCQCEIIADGALPRFQHVDIVESLAPNCSCPAPAKISLGLSKQRCYRAVPSRGHSAREHTHPRSAGKNPAITRSGSHLDILKRCHKFCEPAARKACIRISKYEY